MRSPHIVLTFYGKLLSASGHGEHVEEDWEQEGLAERGRLLAPDKAADRLRQLYHSLFHRRILVYPRVLARLPLGAPQAEFVLWDAVLRASGAWDWRMEGAEALLPEISGTYQAVVYQSGGFTGGVLLKSGARCAGTFLQAGAADMGTKEAGAFAGSLLLRILSSYAGEVSPDETALLAETSVSVFSPASSREFEEAFRKELRGLETGDIHIRNETEFPSAAGPHLPARPRRSGAASPPQ